MDAIKAQVRKYVTQNFLKDARDVQLDDDDSFMANHVIDSVGVLELVSFIEETFGIKVEDEEVMADNLDSVNAVGHYLQRKLDGGA